MKWIKGVVRIRAVSGVHYQSLGEGSQVKGIVGTAESGPTLLKNSPPCPEITNALEALKEHKERSTISALRHSFNTSAPIRKTFNCHGFSMTWKTSSRNSWGLRPVVLVKCEAARANGLDKSVSDPLEVWRWRIEEVCLRPLSAAERYGRNRPPAQSA